MNNIEHYSNSQTFIKWYTFFKLLNILFKFWILFWNSAHLFESCEHLFEPANIFWICGTTFEIHHYFFFFWRTFLLNIFRINELYWINEIFSWTFFEFSSIGPNLRTLCKYAIMFSKAGRVFDFQNIFKNCEQFLNLHFLEKISWLFWIGKHFIIFKIFFFKIQNFVEI